MIILPPTIITYGGQEIWSADVLLSVGAQPNRIILEGDIDQGMFAGPHELFIFDQTSSWTLPEVRLLSIASRPIRWGDRIGSQYVAEDRRWKWWDKLYSCDYNRLKCNGSRYDEKNLREILAELFDLLGEQFYNLSEVSPRLYPTLKYDTQVPVGQILQDLFEMTGHTAGFDFNGILSVYPLGIGQLPSVPNIKSFEQRVVDTRLSFKTVSRPTLFESIVDLVPSAMEEDGEVVALEDATYKPTDGWAKEWPGHFENVATDSQHLASKSVHTLFSTGDVTNNNATGEQSLAGAEIKILETGDCAYNSMRGGVAVDDVTGVFWPEYHRADVFTLEDQSWFGEVKVVENFFVFSRPVFKVIDGDVSPAEMKAKVRHTARKEDSNFVVATSGSGIERAVNWLQPVVVHDEGTNLTDIRTQLDEMRAIFKNERAAQTFMIIIDGIQNVGLNGNTRAVRFKINQGATSGIVDTEIYVGSGWEGLEV